MSTIFSASSPLSPENESQELSTLAAFISHIEGLQDEVRQKDMQISELEKEREQFRKKQDHFEQEQNAMNLQMDIQNKLLMKTRQTDTHIEQLRAAIIDREAIINEKEKSIRDIGRQLEHYKLLLQAQIRRYATMMLHGTGTDNTLPDLNTLAARADIDSWIEKLHERLEKEKSSSSGKRPLDPQEAQIANLRREIDFYVREIIYYKLDIRGYKSDIKKLKRATAQLGTYGSRASDLESDTSSLRPAVTPNNFSEAIPINRPLTPPPSGSAIAANSRVARGITNERTPRHLNLQFPITPRTPNHANEVGHMQPDSSSHSAVRHSPERRKPTVRELGV
jgi:DNA repair exonuclease SbcCD ATPase subunit